MAVLLVGATLVALPANAHVTSGQTRHACVPVVVGECTTGAHTQGANRLGAGFSWTSFEGVVDHLFEWSEGTFVIRCELTSSGGSCTSFGDFPWEGTTFVHRCHEVSGSGPRDWTCFMEHTGQAPLSPQTAGTSEADVWLDLEPSVELAPGP